MAGLFGALRGGIEAKSAVTLDSLPWWTDGARESRSGQVVNHKTALQTSTVLGIAKVLCEDVAQVPWKLKRARKGGIGADLARDHPTYNLLAKAPNSFQTSFEFRETVMLHMVLVGNAFVYKSRVGGRLHELIPLEPGSVAVTRLPDMTLAYKVTGTDGRQRSFGQADIWHMRGLSWNGWMGLEPVKLAREAIGLSLALEDAHAELHANGVQPGGTYSVEGILDETQQTKITGWIKRHAGAGAKGGPLILDNGAKWLQMQMTGVDSQHLETRRFQIEEICRTARVMPIMVGQSEKSATYASAEQMFLAHRIYTLGPWYARIEQSADNNLDLDEDPLLFTEFNADGLMRGDYKSRQEGLNIQRRAGVINADEWRDLDGRNPREDGLGAQYIIEQNMGPQLAKPPEPGSVPAPKGE